MSDTDKVTPRLTPEGKFALILIAYEIPLFFLFLAFDRPELGVSTCVCVAVLLIALRSTWKLHGYVWYWIAVAISIGAQVPFIRYVPWTNHAYRGTALLPFGLADYLVVWGCIKLAEKISKPRGEVSSAS